MEIRGLNGCKNLGKLFCFKDVIKISPKKDLILVESD